MRPRTARTVATLSLPDSPIAARLVEFAALRPGWFDGVHGEAFAKLDLDWLADVWARSMPASRNDALLAPTPDGEISAEWFFGRWDATLDINPSARTGYFHALELDSHEEIALDDLDLSQPAAWARVVAALDDLSSRHAHG
jgi:hypothetical protein